MQAEAQVMLCSSSTMEPPQDASSTALKRCRATSCASSLNKHCLACPDSGCMAARMLTSLLVPEDRFRRENKEEEDVLGHHHFRVCVLLAWGQHSTQVLKTILDDYETGEEQRAEALADEAGCLDNISVAQLACVLGTVRDPGPIMQAQQHASLASPPLAQPAMCLLPWAPQPCVGTDFQQLGPQAPPTYCAAACLVAGAHD